MNDKVTNAHILAAVAKLEGRFEGISALLAAHENNINRRIDDKFLELKDQINAHGQNLDEVARVARSAKELAATADAKAETALGRGARAGLITGAGAGTLIAGAFEAIKMILRP